MFKRESGFTLVELLVVIGVTGLLIAVTAPAVGNYMRWARVTGARQTLESDLHFAQSQAKEERRTYSIAFGANSYSVVRTAGPDTLRTRVMPDGITCAASNDVSFFPWGLTQAATLMLTDGHDSTSMTLSANGNITHD